MIALDMEKAKFKTAQVRLPKPIHDKLLEKQQLIRIETGAFVAIHQLVINELQALYRFRDEVSAIQLELAENDKAFQLFQSITQSY